MDPRGSKSRRSNYELELPEEHLWMGHVITASSHRLSDQEHRLMRYARHCLGIFQAQMQPELDAILKTVQSLKPDRARSQLEEQQPDISTVLKAIEDLKQDQTVIAHLLEENGELRTANKRLARCENQSWKEDRAVSKQQSKEVDALKADNESLFRQLSTAQTKNIKLQEDIAQMKADYTKDIERLTQDGNAHIARLESENAELREQLTAQKERADNLEKQVSFKQQSEGINKFLKELTQKIANLEKKKDRASEAALHKIKKSQDRYKRFEIVVRKLDDLTTSERKKVASLREENRKLKSANEAMAVEVEKLKAARQFVGKENVRAQSKERVIDLS
jgi:chromosome segregation ATPase